MMKKIDLNLGHLPVEKDRKIWDCDLVEITVVPHGVILAPIRGSVGYCELSGDVIADTSPALKDRVIITLVARVLELQALIAKDHE